MFFYRGQGYLVLPLFLLPLVVIGAILNWGFGIDLLRTASRWPLHFVVLLGAVLTFAVGWYLNRTPIEETVYEKTGPVKVLHPRHTFYFIRMEYWGPIIFVIYIVLIGYSSLR